MYDIIQPPFKTLDTTELSRTEIRDQYEWFVRVIPERIEVLEQTVISTKGYEEWRASYLPGSLPQLSAWFTGNVSTRPRTHEEKVTLCAGGLPWFGPEALADWGLTRRTLSLCVDIGMYLGEVLIRNFPELKWRLLSTGSKRYVDYGRPVIGPLKVYDFNPVRGVVMMAYGVARRGYVSGGLEGLCDIQIQRRRG